MKSTCTQYLSLLCLMLFSVQVVFLYANISKQSTLNPLSISKSLITDPNDVTHNSSESSTDKPEQEEKEGSQESEENEEGKELEVASQDLVGEQNSFQLAEMNYFYLLKPSDGIIVEQFSPPECKV